MARIGRWRLLAVGVSVLALVGWSLHFTFWRAQLKRFQVVREGVLYRVGQPSEFGLDHLVGEHAIKTVLSLQLFDCRLHKDWCDWGKADGEMESAYVKSLGIRHLQWPMGEEASWPWLTPWQFEEFFKLLDDPSNHPIAVHCMGGRHRTGTFAALFRLEYDRWPVERALQEMYEFDFGLPVAIQEHHLRTYLPRPRPDASEWQALSTAFRSALGNEQRADYESLVRDLRRRRSEPAAQTAVADYIAQQRPFALALAQRLIDEVQDPLVPQAIRAANQVLQAHEAPAHEWSMSAALIADFGGPDDQSALVELMEAEIARSEVTPRYAAIVAGVTNRYTPNRLPYLKVLLGDTRTRPEPSAACYRYCETAVARLASITDQVFFVGEPTRKVWDDSATTARYWFDSHADATRLTTLLPAPGKNPVRIGNGTETEDLRRMRR